MALTWDLLLVTIEMIEYCGPGRNMFREMEVDVFDDFGWFANVDMKKKRKTVVE